MWLKNNSSVPFSAVPFSEGAFTSADDKTEFKGKWIENRYVWPEENAITFIGAVNEAGKRDGLGICLILASEKIEWCTFENGTRKENVDLTN
jgi:hypothetical protein